MDKLTVGVMLKPSYKPIVGGGFTYYDTLVFNIDRHLFPENLNVVFISIEEQNHNSFNKQIIQINPTKHYSLKDKIKKKLIFFLGTPFMRLFRIFNGLRSSLSKSHRGVYTRYIEQELIARRIDLLYYLIPDSNSLNYPYIMTHWDNGHLSMFSFPEVAMNKTYEKRETYYKTVLGKAFAIFCESKVGKNELIRYTNINPERIFVVPIFAGSVTRLSLEAESQTKILQKFVLEERQYFYYPAQFWSHKNHYNLLLAFKNIIEKYPYLKLVFSGSDKGNLPYLQEVIYELGIENEVVIAGFVDNETLYTFYKHAIALVMPTFLGPTNIPLLEAQAIGCRVICSDLEGHREMLGNDAYYINPACPESISEAMSLCINNSSKPEPQYNPVFTVENAVKQIETHLLRIRSARKVFGYNFAQF